MRSNFSAQARARVTLLGCLAWTVWLGNAAVLSSRAVGQPVDVATRTAARQLGVEGIEAYQAGKYALADEKLEQAYKLFATPTLGLWSARAQVKLGRWIRAVERYTAATHASPAVGDSAVQTEAVEDARSELAALQPRIPTLTVQLQHAAPSEVSVTLDGSPLSAALITAPFHVNPGAHKLVASRGTERVELAVSVAEREQKSASLRFAAPAGQVARVQPAAAPKPVPSINLPAPAALTPADADATSPEVDAAKLVKPLGIAALALGGVSMVVWVASSINADDKLDDCKKVESNYWCQPHSSASAYRTAKDISTVSFWMGLTLGVGGITALLWPAPASKEAPNALTWAVGPNNVSVRGAF